jgi:hypothetical protein
MIGPWRRERERLCEAEDLQARFGIPDPYNPALLVFPLRLDARGLPVYRVRAASKPLPAWLLKLRAIYARQRRLPPP